MSRSHSFRLRFDRVMQTAAVVFGIAMTWPASAQQVLKVGTTPTGAPFAFLDTKTNTTQGVMIDILAGIAKEMNVTIEIQSMQFTSLIPSLTANKLDLVAAPMLITPSRKEIISFSTPIYTYGEALIVPKTDTTEYTRLDQLKGSAVGGQIGGVYIDVLNKSGLFPDVKAYDTFVDVVRDVNAGRIKAALVDYPVIAYNLGLGNFSNTRIVETYQPISLGSIGISMRKDDTVMLAKINASLATLQANGEIATILAKWGLTVTKS